MPVRDWTAAVVCAGSMVFAPPVVAEPYSLVIGIDGLGAMGIGNSVTPNLDALIDGTWAVRRGEAVDYNGAFGAQAYAGGTVGTATQQATSSGPGWSTILTGVWVDRHNVPNNSFTAPDYVNNPSYLELIERNNASAYTAAISQWSPIDSFIVSAAGANGFPVDYRGTGGESAITSQAVTQLQTNDVRAMFLHYDDVDGAGHSSGISSTSYRNTLNGVDAEIGTVLDAVAARPNFANEQWQIIVTGDHGHTLGGGHGGQSNLERTIPFIVSSQTISQGYIPSASGQDSHADVAPTVLSHMGIAVPTHIAGGDQANPVTIRPDFADGLVVQMDFENNLSDTSDQGNHGSVGGGNPSYIAGLHGQAVLLDGSDDYVTLGSPTDLQFGNDTDFTISLWLAVDSNGGDPAIISNKDWDSGGNDGWGIFSGGNGDDFKANQAADGSRTDTGFHDLHNRSLSDARFHHIAAVFDRDGDIDLYRDGFLIDSAAMIPGLADVLGNSINIGQDGTGSYGDDFEGAIDDLAIWRRALSDEEVAILAAGQSFDLLLGRAAGASLEGDLTLDGLVGFDDLDVLLAHWGETVPNGSLALGDADGDGVIGQGDLDLVRANWGEGELPDVNVPEPASALGWLVTLGALMRRRR